jgi:hypothetical protein
MDNESIYILTSTADSLISSDVKTMNDWLTNLEEDELAIYYRMCNKEPDKRTGQEDYEICRHSIVIYCRELGLTELGLNSEFMNKITGAFCLNIVIEGLRRKGVIETKEPLLIYKRSEVKLADDYKKD